MNQRLYSITRKLETTDGYPVIEGEGGGIREVFRASRDYGLRPPTLINTGVQFKALLWRPESASFRVAENPSSEAADPRAPSDWLADVLASRELTKNEPLVLRVLDAEGVASFQTMLSASGLTQGQLRYALARSLETGVVEMVGAQGRKDTVYRLGGGRDSSGPFVSRVRLRVCRLARTLSNCSQPRRTRSAICHPHIWMWTPGRRLALF